MRTFTHNGVTVANIVYFVGLDAWEELKMAAPPVVDGTFPTLFGLGIEVRIREDLPRDVLLIWPKRERIADGFALAALNLALVCGLAGQTVAPEA